MGVKAADDMVMGKEKGGGGVLFFVPVPPPLPPPRELPDIRGATDQSRYVSHPSQKTQWHGATAAGDAASTQR